MSPSKTLYVRDEDVPTWELADQVAEKTRQSVSQLVAAALRHYLPSVRVRTKDDTETITVDVGTEERHQTKAFEGRWLVPYSDDSRTDEDNYLAGACWGIALTKRGKFAVFATNSYGEPGSLTVYDSLDDAETDGHPSDLIAQAAGELGQERVTWLDI